MRQMLLIIFIYVAAFFAPSHALAKGRGGDLSQQIVADSKGMVYVAYVKDGNKVMVKKLVNNEWINAGNILSVQWLNGVNNVSLCMGRNDVPYIAFVSADKRSVIVLKFEEGQWQPVDNTTLAATDNDIELRRVKITTDAAGDLYRCVAAYKKNVGEFSVVSKYENRQWRVLARYDHEDIHDFKGGDNSTVYVAYSSLSFNAAVDAITTERQQGLTSSKVAIAQERAGFQSLAIDPRSNIPYLAFEDTHSFFKLTVMKLRMEGGFGWVYVDKPGISEKDAEHISLAFDGVGTLYVAYRDKANDKKVTVKKHNSGDWEAVGMAGFSAGKAENITLAFDALGVPYVIFKDSENDQTTVMRYKGSAWEVVGHLE